MRSLRIFCTLPLLVALVSPGIGQADSILRDRISVDASDPAAVTVKHALTWTADVQGNPRTELSFHLARGVEVTGARIEDVALTVSSAPVKGTWLNRWTVRLTAPLPQGDSRDLQLETRITNADVPGIRMGPEGGILLPGSGWYPAPRMGTDELLAHNTVLRLPEGHIGVACGTTSGTVSGSEVAGRPFVAWGPWTRSEFTSGSHSFVALRSAGATGDVPGQAKLGDLLDALETAAGPATGTGAWTLVDVGDGVFHGGQRTVFWDEAAGAGPLGLRDTAGAMAASVWTEHLRFDGPLSAMFTRAIPLFLGDAAAAALDLTDSRWATEAKLFGARRAEFLADPGRDRSLTGLSAASPGADQVLRTRGALVIHMTADACPGLAHFMRFLRMFREKYGSSVVDETVFGADLGRNFANQHTHMTPFLETTDLPDFAIVEHGPSEKRSGRYRVAVENRGKIASYVDVATFTKDNVLVRTFRLFVEPGAQRAVLFRADGRIAKIALDPRGTSLTSDVSKDEEVWLEVSPGPDGAPYIPSFEITRAQHDFVAVKDFTLQTNGFSIESFTGSVMWYQTYHGPTGLLMFGKGNVTVSPQAPHAESFESQIGRGSVQFETPAMWIRFPLEVWKEQVEPQLRGAAVADPQPTEREIRFMYDHSFATYYYEDQLAQIPPPDGGLAIISLGGVERRGFVRIPNADGTVFARLWDQLRGVTVWEDKR